MAEIDEDDIKYLSEILVRRMTQVPAAEKVKLKRLIENLKEAREQRGDRRGAAVSEPMQGDSKRRKTEGAAMDGEADLRDDLIPSVTPLHFCNAGSSVGHSRSCLPP